MDWQNNHTYKTFEEILSSLMGRPEQPQQGRFCPQCGASWQDIAGTGKLGCSECYCFFAKQLEPVIQKMHHSPIHRGRLPATAGKEAKQRERRRELEIELKNAIESERYEQAAILRDRLRELGGGNNE